MKKKGFILSGIAVTALVGSIFVGAQAQASSSTTQEDQQTATHYLDALKAGNTAEAVKYVHDYRFKDSAETLAA